VIFVDNRAVSLPGEPDLDPALTETIELAMERTSRR
jgi:wyosine [tRNA(Phe)-imidazoG37] synthetase (radical SAM superfamily)